QQQGHRTGHDRRGHRGAAQVHQPPVGAVTGRVQCGVRRDKLVTVGLRKDEPVAGGDEVRLDQVVVVADALPVVVITSGRPARTVGRYHVVRTVISPEGIGRADGD